MKQVNKKIFCILLSILILLLLVISIISGFPISDSIRNIGLSTIPSWSIVHDALENETWTFATIFSIENYERAPIISTSSVYDGLTAWYRLENNAEDSISTHDGTEFSGSYEACKIQDCYLVDGKNDYITIPDYPETGYNRTQLSVFAWTKGPSQSGGSPVSHFDFGNNQRSWHMVYSRNVPSKLDMRVQQTGTIGAQKLFRSTTDVGDDEWHHIGFVFNNGSFKMYIDGEQEDVTTVLNQTVTQVFDSNAKILIGGLLANGNQVNDFNGSVDEFMIWNRSLTDEEITYVYNSYRPRNWTIPVFNHTIDWDTEFLELGLGPQNYDLSGMEDNIISYYPFEESQTDDIVGDNTLTDFNTDWVYDGKILKGVYCDGYNSYLHSAVSDLDLSNDNISMCIWSKLEEDEYTDYESLSTLGNGSLGRFRLHFTGIHDTNQIYARIDTENNSNIVIGNYGLGNYTDRDWHFTCLTYNKTDKNATIYYDGVDEVASGFVDGAINLGKTQIYITAYNSMNGTVDSLIILNKTLSADDVLQLYDSSKSDKVYVDQNSIRVYEVNQYGQCLNASGVVDYVNNQCYALPYESADITELIGI